MNTSRLAPDPREAQVQPGPDPRRLLRFLFCGRHGQGARLAPDPQEARVQRGPDPRRLLRFLKKKEKINKVSFLFVVNF